MLLSTNFPLVLRFQVNEQQNAKLCECLELTVGKGWACGSADWYSAVGEG